MNSKTTIEDEWNKLTLTLIDTHSLNKVKDSSVYTFKDLLTLLSSIPKNSLKKTVLTERAVSEISLLRTEFNASKSRTSITKEQFDKLLAKYLFWQLTRAALYDSRTYTVKKQHWIPKVYLKGWGEKNKSRGLTLPLIQYTGGVPRRGSVRDTAYIHNCADIDSHNSQTLEYFYSLLENDLEYATITKTSNGEASPFQKMMLTVMVSSHNLRVSGLGEKNLIGAVEQLLNLIDTLPLANIKLVKSFRTPYITTPVKCFSSRGVTSLVFPVTSGMVMVSASEPITKVQAQALIDRFKERIEDKAITTDGVVNGVEF